MLKDVVSVNIFTVLSLLYSLPSVVSCVSLYTTVQHAYTITSRMLEHYGASVSEVADNTEARSQ